jgi:hypothetical protein
MQQVSCDAGGGCDIVAVGADLDSGETDDFETIVEVLEGLPQGCERNTGARGATDPGEFAWIEDIEIDVDVGSGYTLGQLA